MRRNKLEEPKHDGLDDAMSFKHGKIPRKYISKKEINPILFIAYDLKHIGFEFYTIEYKEYIVILDNKSLTYTAINKRIKDELEYTFNGNNIVFKYSPHDIYAVGFEFEITEKGRLLLNQNKNRSKYISSEVIFRRATYIAILIWIMHLIIKL